MRFYAHTGVLPDKSDWEPLPDHLTKVADGAAEMAGHFGRQTAAFAMGALHDVGKATVPFQKRLEIPPPGR